MLHRFEQTPMSRRTRNRDPDRHSTRDREQRLHRFARPSLEPLEIRALLTAALSDLGYVGDTGNVTGLNAAVEVVGYIRDDFDVGAANYAFLIDSSGVKHNFGNFPGYRETTATGISGNGQVIGYSSGPGSSSGLPNILGFLRVNGVMTGLATLDPQDSEAESEPFGVNDSGQVVGWSTVPGAIRAFLYSDGQMTDLGTLGSAGDPGYSVAYGINDSGQVVGNTWWVDQGSGQVGLRAFLDMNGVMTDLGSPFGFQSSGANAINSTGQIVGELVELGLQSLVVHLEHDRARVQHDRDGRLVQQGPGHRVPVENPARVGRVAEERERVGGEAADRGAGHAEVPRVRQRAAQLPGQGLLPVRTGFGAPHRPSR